MLIPEGGGGGGESLIERSSSSLIILIPESSVYLNVFHPSLLNVIHPSLLFHLSLYYILILESSVYLINPWAWPGAEPISHLGGELT